MIKITFETLPPQGNTAKILYNSGPELYDFLYKTKKNTAIDFIEYEYQSNIGFCSHKNISILSNNKNTIATACFYSRYDYLRYSLGTIVNTFRFFGLYEGLKILKNFTHIGSIMASPKKGEIYLSNFSVCENHQGKGLGSQLISLKSDEYRTKKWHSIVLDVADNNPRAKKLYELLEFKTQKSKEFSIAGTTVPNAFEMKLIL